jgi:hypothetical protein
MSKASTTETPAHSCTSCGHLLDAASNPFDLRSPREGDISVCMYCGHLMAFNADMTRRNLTDEEMVEIAGDPQLLMIQHARNRVMKEEKS